MSWIVVDVRGGGVDGWYATRESAEDARNDWAERLGHDDVVVAESNDSRPIGHCFLADRQCDKLSVDEPKVAVCPATDAYSRLRLMQEARALGMNVGQVWEVHVLDGETGGGWVTSLGDFLNKWADIGEFGDFVPTRRYLGIVHEDGAFLVPIQDRDKEQN